MATKYMINEMFSSIHGECNGHVQGRVVTFIRLSGCNLKCFYCDTPDTQSKDNGTEMTADWIIEHINKLGNPYVCITGGEPLEQDLKELLIALEENGNLVSIETNGTHGTINYSHLVDSFVVDWKAPSTGYSTEMNPEAFKHLTEKDFVKFVISNEYDFMVAKDTMIKMRQEGCRATFAFSGVHKDMNPQAIFKLMTIHNVRTAIISVQIHKLIGLE